MDSERVGEDVDSLLRGGISSRMLHACGFLIST